MLSPLDDHYTSMTPPIGQPRVSTQMVTNPFINPNQQGLTSVNHSLQPPPQSESECKVFVKNISFHSYRAPVAQFIEHRVIMREAVSSTPAGPTLRVLK